MAIYVLFLDTINFDNSCTSVKLLEFFRSDLKNSKFMKNSITPKVAQKLFRKCLSDMQLEPLWNPGRNLEIVIEAFTNLWTFLTIQNLWRWITRPAA